MGLTEIKLVWCVPEITHTNKNVESETYFTQ